MIDLSRVKEALASGDSEERRRATAALREVDAELCAEPLFGALGDADWRVRKEAVVVAAELAPSPFILRVLVQALGPSDNVGLRNAAVEALGAYGADTVDAIAEVLQNLDADGRKLAAEALARSAHPSGLLVLRELLQDQDENVRIAAVEAVSEVGKTGAPEAVAQLEACLSSDDSFVRLAALDGLETLGVPVSFHRIQELRSDPLLGNAVLLAAGRSGDRRAARLLVEALPRARGGAEIRLLKAIVELARSGPALVRALKEAAAGLDEATSSRILALTMEGADADVRATALLVLGALSARGAVGAAVKALDDDALVGPAEEALDWIGEGAVGLLLERAESAEPSARALCIEVAARLADASLAAPVRAEALSLLNDTAPEVVRGALGALALVGDGDSLGKVAACLELQGKGPLRRAAESSFAVLAARFPDAARAFAARAAPGESTGHAVAVVIRVVGPPVRGSLAADVDFLSALLTSSSPSVRRAAIEALGAVGGSLAVEPIAYALADEEPAVRASAVRALGRVRSPTGELPGLPQLFALVERASDQSLMVAALSALGESGDARALPILRPLVRSGDPMAAVAAVEAVAGFPELKRVEALIDGLAHPAGEVVKAALRALGETRDVRAVLHLGACLDHPAWDVRRLAADLLGRRGASAAGPLRARLSVEEDPLVREAIGRALEQSSGLKRSISPTRGSYHPR